MRPFPLAAMLTSLPLDLRPAVAEVARLGFTHVDVVALADRPREHLEALADSGLFVACAALGRGLPEGHTLDADPVELRQAALGLLKRQLADAATLGVTAAYVVPGTDASPEALLRFAEGLSLLAADAAERRVRLCLEPVPGRALASAGETLDWLETAGLEGVSLLLDVGHCLISSEDPAMAVRRAGERLGHVHLDDNDGAGDLHWPLFTGRLTPEVLRQLLRALDEVGYDGALAFEFNPQLADPTAALHAGRQTLAELIASATERDIQG